MAMPREEIRTLLITSGTFFLLPDSRYKHSDFSQENPTLGEFCFAMMGYARESVAQESFVHFHCYTISHNALVRVDLRTCIAVVHGLTTRAWKPTFWLASDGFLYIHILYNIRKCTGSSPSRGYPTQKPIRLFGPHKRGKIRENMICPTLGGWGHHRHLVPTGGW